MRRRWTCEGTRTRLLRAIAQNCRTTSFLINDSVLIDAGTGVGDLALEEMSAIDHVFLTHSHLDHIAALPLMLDAVASQRKSPLTLHALDETLRALKTIFSMTLSGRTLLSCPA